MVDLVLVQDTLQNDGIDVCWCRWQLHVQLDSSLVVPLEVHVWLLLVEADPEPVQLLLDKLLVRDRLGSVKDNQDKRARSCSSDDALPPSLAVLGTLNNTRQIKQLDLGTLVPDDAGNTRQGRELVSSSLRMGTGELGEERTLTNRGKADEPDTRVSSCLDIPTLTPPPLPLHLVLNLCPLELRQLRLERAKMRHRRLVLLRARHLRLDVGNARCCSRHGCKLRRARSPPA
mmetsp:Transcript_35064/g.88587  ORF Transcript_35064/g.88587 Transcript_35064/m.88587 type:complete len:231 (-) Transcript_35064:217-909(-)